MRIFALVILLILCAVVAATGQTASTPTAAFVIPEEKSKPVVIPKFDKPPTIDGKLDDEVWRKAAVLKDFYQIQPGDNTPPSKPTEVLIGFDTKFLYIAFKATDEPDKIRATDTRLQHAELEITIAGIVWLDAESGDRLLRRLQRRSELREPAPLHNPTRPRLPPQRTHVLHQGVVPDPQRLLSHKRHNKHKNKCT